MRAAAAGARHEPYTAPVVRLGTLLAVVVIAACGTVGQHAGGSQLSAADVAHDPAVADVYPGSMTPDAKQPGAAAEAAKDEMFPPTNPSGFPTAQGTASRPRPGGCLPPRRHGSRS